MYFVLNIFKYLIEIKLNLMYTVDYIKKEIKKTVDEITYVRDIKSARDYMKYRIFAGKLLLSYKENKGFSVYHYLPRDMHDYTIKIRLLNENKRISDLKVYREYFINILKRIINYYPEFYKILANLKVVSTIRMYRDFDNIFRCCTGSDPIFLGMALSLEMRINTINGSHIKIDLIKSIMNNEQFKIININKSLNIINSVYCIDSDDNSYNNSKKISNSSVFYDNSINSIDKGIDNDINNDIDNNINNDINNDIDNGINNGIENGIENGINNFINNYNCNDNDINMMKNTIINLEQRINNLESIIYQNYRDLYQNEYQNVISQNTNVSNKNIIF